MIAKLKTIKRSLGLGKGFVWSWLINKPLESETTVVRNNYSYLFLALQNEMNNRGFFLPLSDNEYKFSFSTFFNSNELTPF